MVLTEKPILASEYLLWMGGECKPGKGPILALENPTTCEVVSQIHTASHEDVEEAVRRAQDAFDSQVWQRMAPADRATVLSGIARIFSERVPELAKIESLQTGRTYREMSTQLARLGEWFEYFAAVCRTEEGSVQPTRGLLLNYVKRVPLGCVAQITPFNHPLLISVKKLAPALAAGNSVIIKPSELAPITVLELAKICREAGLPDGVLSVLPGLGPVTGKSLVSHPLIRKVDLTGGTEGGRAVGEIVGRNLAAYTAELGGKAPVVVFDSADIQMAANGVAFSAFVASGQTCVSGTRVLVHRSLWHNFMEAFLPKVNSISQRMGDPFNSDSMMGPIISAKQLANVMRLVQSARDEGAEVLFGGVKMTGSSTLDGTRFSEGYFYPPTVIAKQEGANKLTIWKEEAFGPVVVCAPFDTEAEAIQLANESEFGLGCGVWTQDHGQAIRASEGIQCGLVWVNTHHRNDASSPWGGLTKASGLGRENGREAYHAYTQAKSVIMSYATVEQSRAQDDWFREGEGQVRYG